MDRKTIASWCLYDFANSFYVVLPAVIWQTYFQRAIVGNERGLGDLWWGRIISLSMLLVALSSPVMGAIADSAGVRKRLLIGYTLTSVGAVCLFPTVRPGMLWWGFVVTLVSYVAFEGGIVFYNAYLPEIAPRDHQGRVSGWGFATGYVGSLLGLLAAYPFVQHKMYHAVFLMIAVAFLVFSLPAFIYLPTEAPAQQGVMAAGRAGLRESWRTLREILFQPALREMRWFLFSYVFFEDGVNTVIYFAAGFASKTLGFSDTENIALFLVVQISALVGAYLWAMPTDKLGPKRVVMLMLLQWSAVVAVAYFVETKTTFFVVAVLAGTGLGAIQAASRAFMSTLIPKGKEADFFGFYSLVGKASAIMGPIVFGGVSRATGGNQRLAILSIGALFVVGALILSRARAGGPTGLPAHETHA
jgi:UMF1 family MFS transporter